MPDPFNFLNSSHNMIPFSDYQQQQLLSNHIRNIGINATRRVICYDQPIYNDMHLEVAEYFGMTLTVQMTRTTFITEIRPMYDQVAILILDDDGEKDRAHTNQPLPRVYTYKSKVFCISEGIAIKNEQVFMHSFHTFTSEAVVGLERTIYSIFEDVGVVEVCAIVYSPTIDCPIVFPFDVSLSTSDNTAGIGC